MYDLRWVKSLRHLLLLAIPCFITSASFGQSVAPLRASLSLENQEVPLHALMKARLEITNEDAEHPYVVHLGLDNEGAFTLTIKEPDGTVTVFRKQPTEGLHATGRNTIQPGSTYTQDLILNRWYGFPTKGTYAVTLAMTANVTEAMPDRTAKGPAMQDLLVNVSQNVVVSPRDEAYLRQQCEQLLETIRSAPSYDDVLPAADGLDAIHDPIAASYLTQAAKAKPPIAYRFISGLESLATNGAVEGLLELAKSPDEETKALAMSSLQRIEMASQNDPLKDEIKSGLATLYQH